MTNKQTQLLLKEFGNGAAIPQLTGKQISNFKLINPPLHLQNQFAERVAKIEQQKEQAQQALAKSEELFQSLLQKSFKE